jgi:hypothetical protein
MNIHQKKHRINGAFSRFKSQDESVMRSENQLIKRFQVSNSLSSRDQVILEIDQNEQERRVLDYFSNSKRREIDSLPRNLVDIPSTCRARPGTKLKPSCQFCLSVCAYPIDALVDSDWGINSIDLQNELESHGHAKTREINHEGQPKRWRSKEEALSELVEHYVHIHNQSRPIFLIKMSLN